MDKLSTFVQCVYMEEPTLQRLTERLATTVSFCTDMGVESGIAEVAGFEVASALPEWQQETPLIDDDGLGIHLGGGPVGLEPIN